jgi:hypothetical protein
MSIWRKIHFRKNCNLPAGDLLAGHQCYSRARFALVLKCRRRDIFVAPAPYNCSSSVGAAYFAPTELSSVFNFISTNRSRLRRYEFPAGHSIGHFFNPQSWPRIFRATGFAGQSSVKPKPHDRCSFVPGEKVRMRAGVRHKSKSVYTTVLTPALSSEGESLAAVLKIRATGLPDGQTDVAPKGRLHFRFAITPLDILSDRRAGRGSSGRRAGCF